MNLITFPRTTALYQSWRALKEAFATEAGVTPSSLGSAFRGVVGNSNKVNLLCAQVVRLMETNNAWYNLIHAVGIIHPGDQLGCSAGATKSYHMPPVSPHDAELAALQMERNRVERQDANQMRAEGRQQPQTAAAEHAAELAKAELERVRRETEIGEEDAKVKRDTLDALQRRHEEDTAAAAEQLVAAQLARDQARSTVAAELRDLQDAHEARQTQITEILRKVNDQEKLALYFRGGNDYSSDPDFAELSAELVHIDAQIAALRNRARSAEPVVDLDEIDITSLEDPDAPIAFPLPAQTILNLSVLRSFDRSPEPAFRLLNAYLALPSSLKKAFLLDGLNERLAEWAQLLLSGGREAPNVSRATKRKRATPSSDEDGSMSPQATDAYNQPSSSQLGNDQQPSSQQTRVEKDPPSSSRTSAHPRRTTGILSYKPTYVPPSDMYGAPAADDADHDLANYNR
jgi:hypothetical protein